MQVVRRFEVLTHVTLDSSQRLLMNLFNKQTLNTCPKHPESFDLIDQIEFSLEASNGEELEEEGS